MKLLIVLLAVAAAYALVGSAREFNIAEDPTRTDAEKRINLAIRSDGRVVRLDDSSSGDDDIDNKLFPYDLLTGATENKKLIDILPARDSDWILESSASDSKKIVETPNLSVSPSLAGSANGKPDATLSDKVKAIAFNSREVRLVGPDQKEVEMKDDVATKVVVALENLQKEATEVWGQMNEKLDKGWTELKSMVEKAVASDASKKSSSTAANRQLREAKVPAAGKEVVVSDLDNYSMADNGGQSTSSKIAESASNTFKGLLTNIGLTEDKQKQAGEALSKAGTSVSETVTKDLPAAMKKAGDAVSETITKDLPDAVKNFLG